MLGGSRPPVSAAVPEALEGREGRPTSATTQDDPAPGAFGFAYGEERRYEMGPRDALGAGEAATWSLRLEEIREDDPSRLATFALTHQYDASPPQSLTYQQGELVTLRFEASLTVNADGFPVEMDAHVTRDLFGIGQEAYSLHYTWSDEHFVKRVRLEGQEWDVDVGVPGHEHLDRSRPSGVYAWLASGLPCMGLKPALDAFGRLQTARECREGGEWGFANPGLLSLLLPALYEAKGERSFLFFAPTGPDLYGSLASTVGGSPRSSGAFGRPPTASEIGRARDPSRYFERADVRFGERVEVEVGGRSLEVWKLEVGGRVRAIYLDDDDRVVRLDVAPHPVTLEARWIRLLFPSEF